MTQSALALEGSDSSGKGSGDIMELIVRVEIAPADASGQHALELVTAHHATLMKLLKAPDPRDDDKAAQGLMDGGFLQLILAAFTRFEANAELMQKLAKLLSTQTMRVMCTCRMPLEVPGEVLVSVAPLHKRDAARLCVAVVGKDRGAGKGRRNERGRRAQRQTSRHH